MPFQTHNVQFYKRQLLSEEDLEDVVNNMEDIEFSGKSSENVSRLNSVESENMSTLVMKSIFSTQIDERREKGGLVFIFILLGIWAQRSKFKIDKLSSS